MTMNKTEARKTIESLNAVSSPVELPQTARTMSEYERGRQAGITQVYDSILSAMPQPLTDEQIDEALSINATAWVLLLFANPTTREFRQALLDFARVIERAHGIGGKP